MMQNEKRMTQIRNAARKMKLLAQQHVSLDVLAHDESELQELRFHARDASDIDAMGADEMGFHSTIRDYHAR